MGSRNYAISAQTNPRPTIFSSKENLRLGVAASNLKIVTRDHWIVTLHSAKYHFSSAIRNLTILLEYVQQGFETLGFSNIPILCETKLRSSYFIYKNF